MPEFFSHGALLSFACSKERRKSNVIAPYLPFKKLLVRVEEMCLFLIYILIFVRRNATRRHIEFHFQRPVCRIASKYKGRFPFRIYDVDGDNIGRLQSVPLQTTTKTRAGPVVLCCVLCCALQMGFDG